jgi:hypothetical protein
VAVFPHTSFLSPCFASLFDRAQCFLFFLDFFFPNGSAPIVAIPVFVYVVWHLSADLDGAPTLRKGTRPHWSVRPGMSGEASHIVLEWKFYPCSLLHLFPANCQVLIILQARLTSRQVFVFLANIGIRDSSLQHLGSHTYLVMPCLPFPIDIVIAT